MAKKRSVKRSSQSARKKSSSSKRIYSEKKSRFVLRNTILFAVLFIISVGAYNAFTNEFYLNLSFILALIFGVIAVALLISWLVLWLMKISKKK